MQDFNIGEQRNSSRVLKPPGGGHSDIFGAPDVRSNAPRPKYDQQNSSNLNFVMNTTDPNLAIKQAAAAAAAAGGGGGDNNHSAAPAAPETVVPAAVKGSNGTSERSEKPSPSGGAAGGDQGGRTRVPPGGFSSGFW